jgi:membrane protein YdbS with pleckstrin-like domain
MAQPTVALREPNRRVSPRARTMWQVSALVEAAMTFTVMAVVDRLVDGIDLPWWAFALAVGVHVGWAAVVPQWRYLVHRWEVTETAVYTQTGWWARERRIAPMSRIQTVDHAEGAVERLFRLATVTVTTASAAGALRISGLDKDVARQLVDELTLKADAVEGDAT